MFVFDIKLPDLSSGCPWRQSITRSITPSRIMAQPTISPMDWLAPFSAVRKRHQPDAHWFVCLMEVRWLSRGDDDRFIPDSGGIDANRASFNRCRALVLPFIRFSPVKKLLVSHGMSEVFPVIQRSGVPHQVYHSAPWERLRRGHAAWARQGNSKKVGCSQNPINCSEPFPVPFSGKMTLSLDV
jgi:hypothetical protein